MHDERERARCTTSIILTFTDYGHIPCTVHDKQNSAFTMHDRLKSPPSCMIMPTSADQGAPLPTSFTLKTTVKYLVSAHPPLCTILTQKWGVGVYSTVIPYSFVITYWNLLEGVAWSTVITYRVSYPLRLFLHIYNVLLGYNVLKVSLKIFLHGYSVL